VNDAPIARVGRAPYRSTLVEKALQELSQMAVTEACVSGSCDICVFQTDLCMMANQHGENPHPSRRSR
jgi:hypothetical protein